jgi:plasmid maintenance system antidote protein VapI
LATNRLLKADLSAGMALRFEKAFGVDMDTLARAAARRRFA